MTPELAGILDRLGALFLISLLIAIHLPLGVAILRAFIRRGTWVPLALVVVGVYASGWAGVIVAGRFGFGLFWGICMAAFVLVVVWASHLLGREDT